MRKHIAVKSIAGIVALLILFTVIVGIIGYNGVTNALMKQYADGAFLTAQTAAQTVNADRMDVYTQRGQNTAAYISVWTALDRLCNSTDAMFIYVIIPDRTDYGHITFVFSTMDRDSRYSRYEYMFVRETTNDDYREKYRLLCEGLSEKELVVRDKGYIETDPHITAMIPLKDSEGQTQAILCVQRQMDAVASARRGMVREILIIMLTLVVLVILGQALYLNLVLLKPVKKITDEASRFARENTKAQHRLKETIRNSDEIGQLAESVDQMEERIVDYVDNLTKATAERERITTELSLANRIQADMLPSVFPPFPERGEIDLYASMKPAREIGGDFYDFFLTDDDHLCMVMADVSGKGIPAAMFMMSSMITLSTNAKQGYSPAQILERTNESICASNKEEMFVTVWLGILEISTGRLVAANAGHEYPMLINPGEDAGLFKDRHGFVIGGMGGISYQEYELQMKPGSKLFVYTDGLPEATDAEGNMFGTQRMLDALTEAKFGHTQEILQHMQKRVDTFVKEAEQFDDLTMLCLEYKGGQHGRLDQ